MRISIQYVVYNPMHPINIHTVSVCFVLFSLYYRFWSHYDDVIMSAIASQITSLTIVYSTDYPGADQSKHQSSASLAFVWGIHRGPVNSPHKWPVTRKMFPFDDVIMYVSDPFVYILHGCFPATVAILEYARNRPAPCNSIPPNV